MSAPSAEEIRVATQALRDEGKIWLAEAPNCGSLSTSVENLNRSRLEAGIFQIYIGSYRHVCSTISALLKGAETAMESIGNTLIASADQYDQEEQNNVHRAQQKW